MNVTFISEEVMNAAITTSGQGAGPGWVSRAFGAGPR
jgi:hypothetical protein